MAVEILKPGKDPRDMWVYFKCVRCGCEFRVSLNETVQACIITSDYNNFDVTYFGDCPICHQRLCGSIETKEE